MIPARTPIVAVWGAGVDSTAMIIELVERSEPPDVVLMADAATVDLAGRPSMRDWMAQFPAACGDRSA